jgi:hypothetical protein
MSAPADNNPAALMFQGLASGLSDGKRPRLLLATPSGRIREVALTRRDLVRIIQQAAASLEVLDRDGARR